MLLEPIAAGLVVSIVNRLVINNNWLWEQLFCQAETVGDATFGGTISVRTINPRPTPIPTLNSSYGSYNTSDNSVRLDTGGISSLNGASAVFCTDPLSPRKITSVWSSTGPSDWNSRPISVSRASITAL